MNFIEKLAKAVQKNHSLLCIGLDPDPAMMPEKIGVFEFNKAIIEATADLKMKIHNLTQACIR